MSVRQLGMGNVGIGEDDILRAWTNPALVLGLKGRGVLAGDGSSMFGGGRSAGLGVGWQVTPNFGIGGMVVTRSVSFQEVDALAEPVGSFASRISSGSLIMAVRPAAWLRMGVAAKMVRDELEVDVGRARALDGGVAVGVGRVSAGVAIRNLGTALRSGDTSVGGNEFLPLEERIGVNYQVIVRKVNAAMEFVSSANHDPTLNAGLEWWIVKSVGIRAGASALRAVARKWTGGVTVSRGPLSLDYAFSSQQVGMMHHASITYVFGELSPIAEIPSRTVDEPMAQEERGPE